MASKTAQIAVGQAGRYHGGIYPTHTLWLSENSRPAWILEPTGWDLGGGTLAPEAEESDAWTTEPVCWVPGGPEHILEDGLLLIAVHVLRAEPVLEFVRERLPALEEIRVPFKDKPVELDAMPKNLLAKLRRRCAQLDLHYKLVVTVLEGSSIRGQLPVLDRYPMEVEVCTVSYSRVGRGFAGSGKPEPRGSLTASWPGDDPPDDRYYAVNIY